MCLQCAANGKDGEGGRRVKKKDNAGGQGLEIWKYKLEKSKDTLRLWGGSNGWPQKQHCSLREQLILDILRCYFAPIFNPKSTKLSKEDAGLQRIRWYSSGS